MIFKIKDLDFSLDFSDVFKICEKLVHGYNLKYVQFYFNGVKLRVYKNTNENELFKLYTNKVK